jgi:hypothetical protein
MAEKPRVKAPKQRQTPTDAASRRRAWTIGAAVVGVAAGFAVVAVLLGLVGGSDGPDEEALRADLQAAGCTLRVAPTRGYPENSHAVTDPNGTSPQWNTDPPTSGPHFGVAAIFGIYEEELQLARVVHNLEHGGVFILYGDEVPDETVEQLRAFYDDRQAGTIMAPLDRLGDEFALGAWVFEGDVNNGYLAKCRTFDEDAVSSFFGALQFRGPERFDPADLRPGH